MKGKGPFITSAVLVSHRTKLAHSSNVRYTYRQKLCIICLPGRNQKKVECNVREGRKCLFLNDILFITQVWPLMIWDLNFLSQRPKLEVTICICYHPEFKREIVWELKTWVNESLSGQIYGIKTMINITYRIFGFGVFVLSYLFLFPV